MSLQVFRITEIELPKQLRGAPVRLDVFSTARNDVILTCEPKDASQLSGWGWDARGDADSLPPAEAGLPVPPTSLVVVMAALRHSDLQSRESWCMQASLVIKAEERLAGTEQRAELCRAHLSDYEGQPNFLPSGFFVRYRVERGDEASLLARFPPEPQRLDTANQRDFPPFAAITETLAQPQRRDRGSQKTYFDSDVWTDRGVYVADWAGQIPLPAWRTDLGRIDSLPLAECADLLAFLLGRAASLAVDVSRLRKDAGPEACEWMMRWVQVASQLFANAVPYITDYVLLPGGKLDEGQVLLNPLLYGAGDCEDLSMLSAALARAYLRDDFDALYQSHPRAHPDHVRAFLAGKALLRKHAVNVKVRVSLTYQLDEQGGGEPRLHCTAFIFYRLSSEQNVRWAGIDGVNPRCSLLHGPPGAAVADKWWGRLQTGGEDLASFARSSPLQLGTRFIGNDLRFELNDSPEGGWMREKVAVTQHFGPGEQVAFVMSRRNNMMMRGTGGDGNEWVPGEWLSRLRDGTRENVVAEPREPELWRLKPSPWSKLASCAKSARTVWQSGRCLAEDYIARVVSHPRTDDDEGENNAVALAKEIGKVAERNGESVGLRVDLLDFAPVTSCFVVALYSS